MELSDRDVIDYKNQEVYYDERLAGFYFGTDGFQILDKIMEDTIEVVGNINFEKYQKLSDLLKEETLFKKCEN
jgi:hypothetical protein